MRSWKFALTIGALGLVVSTLSACSGSSSSDGGSSGTPLTITGGFQSLTFVPMMEDNGLFTPQAATDYTMICNMLVSPFTSGSSPLDSDGSFTLSIAGAAGNPIGCFLTKAGVIAAVIEFTAASSSFSGAAGGSAYVPNSDSTTLTFPTNITITNGVAAVAATGVTENGTTAPTLAWTDPTGTWSITGACENGINKETGVYESNCVGAQSEGGDIPTSVYLKQVSATMGGETKNGLAIWKDVAARNACGGVEGEVDLNGFTDVGGWSAPFTGHTALNFSTVASVLALAAKAKAPVYSGNIGVCGETVPTPGTTKCSDLETAFQTPVWGGMSPEACMLNCVISAIGHGGGDDDNFDFGSDSCKLRYRARWENGMEYMNDKDFNNGGAQVGLFADGECDPSFDGCKQGTTIMLEPEDRGPNDRYMFGELFINGPVGTIIQREHSTNNYRVDNSTMISCGGARIEKFTMVQQSATKATVTVEQTFVADRTNAVGCATNSDFARNANNESTLSLTLSK